MATNFQTISDFVKEGDDKQVSGLVKTALEEHIPATEILNKGLIPGIQALSENFKNGEAFLPEILISVRAMNAGLELIKPHLASKDFGNQGIVVLGTVEGDIHNIGKDLVGMMLQSNGFMVIDVGVDTPPETFVKAVRENHADILAMSALLTTTITSYIPVLKNLEKEGLRNKVKVLVGGAAVTQEYADEIGAEGFAIDCISAVDEAKRLMNK